MSELHGTPYARDARCIAKVAAADAELGNLILNREPSRQSCHEAAWAVLNEVDGVPDRAARFADGFASSDDVARAGSVGAGSAPEYDPQLPRSQHAITNGAPENGYDPRDIGRKYLPSNGGCAYIDLDHVEVCTPEVRSAWDFVAAWHAQLRIVRAALAAANAKRADGERIVVLVNSSDGLGHAYGSHLNFLVTRRLFDDLLVRKLHPELFVLIAYQVSSIVFAGQGKVGAENGRPPVAFQLTQRGDFFDRLVAPQTTYDRPIVNSRDEPLCGPRYDGAVAGAGLARLHCIFYDSTLAHVATLLKVGVMQIVLSMLEAGRLDAQPMLADPLTALMAYGHDPELLATARLDDGRNVTAVELQAMFCERARAYVEAGGCDELVPGSSAIVELWEDTLDLLARRDFDRLAPRLDWVMKRLQIERALVARGLDWSAPEAKHLDHLYASLDAQEGLYWALEAAGATETVVADERIARFVHAPPDDTRAWTRAMLLSRLPRARIRTVDWDTIELAPAAPGDPPVRLDMPDPRGHTRAQWIGAGTDRALGKTERSEQAATARDDGACGDGSTKFCAETATPPSDPDERT